MNGERLKKLLPYVGLPVIAAGFFIAQYGNLEAWDIFRYEVLIVFGYLVSLGDIKAKIIPNKILLLMIAVWMIIIIPRLFMNTTEALSLLTTFAIGGALAGGLFLLVYFVSKKGLGGGDVKFMAVLGLYLGFNGVLPTMLIGSIFAATFAIVLILLKRIEKKDTIPLAPFLYAGALVSIFLL